MGVDREASILEIARARRRLAKRYHPDVAGASSATARMREVNEAWSILADPSARSAWDQLHPRARDAAAWVSWAAGCAAPTGRGVAVDKHGGNGWWWTLAAVTALLVFILVGGLIAAIDGPSPGIRDSPVLQDNLDRP